MDGYKVPPEDIKKVEFSDEGLYVTFTLPDTPEQAMQNRYPRFQEVSIDELGSVHDIYLGQEDGEREESS